jgi:hypothetical protein
MYKEIDEIENRTKKGKSESGLFKKIKTLMNGVINSSQLEQNKNTNS